MTLPLRADGGIDWDRIIFPTKERFSYGWIIPDNRIHRVSVFEFNQMLQAHTRERCAKWHDEQELSYLRSRDKFSDKGLSWDNLDRMATEHRKSAAAFRKMED